MIYLPDLCLALGLLIVVGLGWRRAPERAAAVVGLAAVLSAGAALVGQPAGFTGPGVAWATFAPFAVRLDRRMDDLAWGSGLALLAGLAIWLSMAVLTPARSGGRALPGTWSVAAALAAGWAVLNTVLAADVTILGASWVVAGLATYAVNVLADEDPAAAGRLLPGLGAMVVAGAAVTGLGLAAGRVSGSGGYALLDLPWPLLDASLVGLALLALLIQLGQWPLLGATLHGAAISRGVLVPVPALYLILRLTEILNHGPVGQPSAWDNAWPVLAGAGALGGLGALAAWGGGPFDRRLALVSAAGWGLVAWGLGLHTPLGRTAAVSLALALGLAHLGLDPRLGRWRLVALAGLGGVPLLAGFGGLWLLAGAFNALDLPGLGLVPLLVLGVGAAALWPGLAAAAPRPPVPFVGAGIAGGLLLLGLLPGTVLLPAVAVLVSNGVLPPTLLIPDWGLAGGGAPGPAGAWPVTALAGLAVLGLTGGTVLAWRRRRVAPLPASPPWQLDAEALVPVAQAFRLDWLLPAAAAHSPGDRLATGIARLLRLAGQALFAAEGSFYLPFTVLMLLLVLLALTR